MSKKWLSSVALGAFIWCCQVFGVTFGGTVHDVWKMDFDHDRWDLDKLKQEDQGFYKEKKKKDCVTTEPGGILKESCLYKTSSQHLPRGHWNDKTWYSYVGTLGSAVWNIRGQLTNTIKNEYKQKTITDKNTHREYGPFWATNEVANIQEEHIFKHFGKDARPIAPYQHEGGLYDELNSDPQLIYNFYGTEHTATTNIISDTEAYIQGVIRESGYVHTYYDYIVEEPVSWLRTYTKHITTDANHIYEEMDDYRDMKGPLYNVQRHMQTQYAATFNKKGCKNVKEKNTTTEEKQPTDWYKNYWPIITTSIHNEPAPTYGVRSGVAVDEHTQSMLDELNRSAGVRVVVRSTKEPSTTLAAAGSGKAPIQQQEDEQSGNNRAARTGPRVRVIRNPSFDRRKLNGGNDGI